jgi:hypothetical protein
MFGVPKLFDGKRFYSASETAYLAGVHRLTLLRWIREGKLADVARVRNGWRLFSEDVVQQVVEFAKGINTRSSPNQRLLFSGQTSASSDTFTKSVLNSRE